MVKSTSEMIVRANVSPVKYFLLVFLVSMVVAGCSKPHMYIHPSPGLERIKKMAVMPFDNMTKDSKSGEKVRSGFVLELLRTGSFNVIIFGASGL